MYRQAGRISRSAGGIDRRFDVIGRAAGAQKDVGRPAAKRQLVAGGEVAIFGGRFSAGKPT
jgi:hypothetical protein